jgi:hypothetical protein
MAAGKTNFLPIWRRPASARLKFVNEVIKLRPVHSAGNAIQVPNTNGRMATAERAAPPSVPAAAEPASKWILVTSGYSIVRDILKRFF